MKFAKTSHVFSNTAKQWAISGIIYLFLFFLFILYYEIRNKPFSLLTTEKCTAIASICSLALALALGPLSRFFPSLFKVLQYRRSLGITAAFMSIPHVILVFTCLPLKFPEKYSAEYPLSWFVDHWFTTAMGFLCLLLFMAIALHSYPAGVRKLGMQRWKILQKLSYLVMVLVVLHLMSMGKIPKNWINWIETRNHPLPPGSFPQMVICVSTLLLKIADMIFHGDSLARKTNEAEAPHS